MLYYIGQSFIVGIPARDLEESELEQYGGEKFLLKTGLYTKDAPQKSVKAKHSNKMLHLESEDKEN